MSRLGNSSPLAVQLQQFVIGLCKYPQAPRSTRLNCSLCIKLTPYSIQRRAPTFTYTLPLLTTHFLSPKTSLTRLRLTFAFLHPSQALPDLQSQAKARNTRSARPMDPTMRPFFTPTWVGPGRRTRAQFPPPRLPHLVLFRMPGYSSIHFSDGPLTSLSPTEAECPPCSSLSLTLLSTPSLIPTIATGPSTTHRPTLI